MQHLFLINVMIRLFYNITNTIYIIHIFLPICLDQNIIRTFQTLAKLRPNVLPFFIKHLFCKSKCRHPDTSQAGSAIRDVNYSD